MPSLEFDTLSDFKKDLINCIKNEALLTKGRRPIGQQEKCECRSNKKLKPKSISTRTLKRRLNEFTPMYINFVILKSNNIDNNV